MRFGSLKEGDSSHTHYSLHTMFEIDIVEANIFQNDVGEIPET
jgi:hypothetical protein